MNFDFRSIWEQTPAVALLVIGFGFVIFWHELGHFLAAKWAGVRVEQFAVGFGHALFSWRKGVGLRFGSTNKEYVQKVRDYLRQEAKDEPQLSETTDTLEGLSDRQVERACDVLQLGETEYRLNWIPLGGYVKMLGQDDMNPNSLDVSPRAFNMKPVGKRMVIVSAGVIMNVILAMILFAVLFTVGFKVPAPVVGAVMSGSPAQAAGIEPGDKIWTIDDKIQHDFNKIQLSVALARDDGPIPIVVYRPQPDGSAKEKLLQVSPRRNDRDSAGFLMLGIAPAPELAGPDPKSMNARQIREYEQDLAESNPDAALVKLGETIVEVNGVQIANPKTDYFKFAEQVKLSEGAPVKIKIRDAQGNVRQANFRPSFAGAFGNDVSFAGMQPRAIVGSLLQKSSAKGKLFPGDRIASIQVGQSPETIYDPTVTEARKVLGGAGKAGQNVSLQVVRNGQTIEVKDLTPNVALESGGWGLGIGLLPDYMMPVVGGVEDKSPAADAKLPPRAIIRSINGADVSDWYGVWRAFKSKTDNHDIEIAYTIPGNDQLQKTSLKWTDDDRKQIASYCLISPLELAPLNYVRQTGNVFEAMSWGVAETKDLILQFYVTLQRMVVQRSVSAKNMMGPYGIIKTGAIFANRGNDWLIWFLAMISANLAVVNFLPIPIVDGGLFVFLILEKLRGRPLSPSVQTAAHLAGLVLLLSVLVFVTYNDFTR